MTEHLAQTARVAARGHFPFGFGRQARAAPVGKSGGLEQGHPAERARALERAQAVQRELAPVAGVVALPVQGLRQAKHTDLVPAFGQPQRSIAVAARVDEGEVVAVRHQMRGQRVRLHVLAVARQLVVEAEAVAVVADVDQAAGKTDPRRRHNALGRSRRRWRVGAVGRVQRALRQQMQDVGEDQFLVLLLVLHTEFDQRRQCFNVGIVGVAIPVGQQTRDAGVDIGAPGAHLVHRRARQQAAPGARIALADAVVVRVEQHPKGWMKGLEARLHGFQDEGFEKPRGVRQVPLDGAGVGHRLGAAVFVRQRRGQRQRARAHAGVTAPPDGFVGRLHGGRRFIRSRSQRHCAIARAWITANQPASSVQTWVAWKPDCSSSPTAAAGRYL